MRHKIKIPRILGINRVEGHEVSVVFNNGESRTIDFQKVLKHLKIDSDSPANILFDEKEFAKVKLIDNTLSWNNVEQYISSREGGKVRVPFEIGADVLYRFSKPEKQEFLIKIGRMIKEFRMKAGLTQQELALRSGTTRNYISRIESGKSDINLGTLTKIIESGFGKKANFKIE